MSDLIDRQTAISLPVMPKKYRKYQTYNLDDVYEQGWEDLQKCIERLPSAQSQWIPCSEKLHGKERVLITMRDGCVTIGRQFDKNDWSTHEGKYSAYDFDVVAWMPLPEKYEG